MKELTSVLECDVMKDVLEHDLNLGLYSSETGSASNLDYRNKQNYVKAQREYLAHKDRISAAMRS